MERKIIICAFSAFFLLMEINCVQVLDSNENSTTVSEPLMEPEKKELISETTTFESLKENKSRNIEDELNSDQKITASSTTSSTTTTTHKIPPTLLNSRIESRRETSEKPVKSLKDFA